MFFSFSLFCSCFRKEIGLKAGLHFFVIPRDRLKKRQIPKEAQMSVTLRKSFFRKRLILLKILGNSEERDSRNLNQFSFLQEPIWGHKNRNALNTHNNAPVVINEHFWQKRVDPSPRSIPQVTGLLRGDSCIMNDVWFVPFLSKSNFHCAHDSLWCLGIRDSLRSISHLHEDTSAVSVRVFWSFLLDNTRQKHRQSVPFWIWRNRNLRLNKRRWNLENYPSCLKWQLLFFLPATIANTFQWSNEVIAG